MKAKFYQRLLPINKLIFVGEHDIPEYVPVYMFPIKEPLNFAHIGDGTMPPQPPLTDAHSYWRQRDLLNGEVRYIANIEMKVK